MSFEFAETCPAATAFSTSLRRVPNCRLINQSPIYSLNETRLRQTEDGTHPTTSGACCIALKPHRVAEPSRFTRFPGRGAKKAEKILRACAAGRASRRGATRDAPAGLGRAWVLSGPGKPGNLPRKEPYSTLLFALGKVPTPTVCGFPASLLTHQSSSDIERRNACPMLNCRLSPNIRGTHTAGVPGSESRLG